MGDCSQEEIDALLKEMPMKIYGSPNVVLTEEEKDAGEIGNVAMGTTLLPIYLIKPQRFDYYSKCYNNYLKYSRAISHTL